MAAIEPTAPAAASFLAVAVSRLVARVAAIGRAWANRRHAMALWELSDHQLADIGLSRGDLAEAMRLPISRDPTASLADIARRGSIDADLVRLRR